MDLASTILSFFILLGLLAFFAGTEIPLMSISAHKLESFLRERRFGAKTLADIKKNNEQLLIVNLIGTTVVTIAISSISTVVAIRFAGEFGFSGDQAVGWAIFIASAVILLFGEIAPKIIGVRFTETTALAVAPIYSVLMFLFRPLNFLIHFFVRLLNFVTGGKGDMHGSSISAEELIAFIDLSREKGAVEDDEHRKIKNILDLSETDASSVMTPRVQVEFISCETTVGEAMDIFLNSSHSRLPVYQETPDNIDHVVTLREILEWNKAGLTDAMLCSLELEKIIKVPVTKPIDSVFEIFQRAHKHIALVIDEHGGVAGVITMEDIVEEVFGDIKDEKDREAEYMKKFSDGTMLINGGVLIDDIIQEFEIDDITDIGLDESFLGETVSYVIISLLERFPDPNETLTIGSS